MTVDVDRSADAPDDIIEAVRLVGCEQPVAAVVCDSYDAERELNREITAMLNTHDVQRCWRADIRSQIVANWRILRTEYPDDGTWSP